MPHDLSVTYFSSGKKKNEYSKDGSPNYYNLAYPHFSVDIFKLMPFYIIISSIQFLTPPRFWR